MMFIIKQLLRPATKLGQVYVFTHVCDSVHSGCAIPACIASGIPACLAAGLQGGLLLGGAWSRGCLVWGGSAPEGVPGLGGCLVWGVPGLRGSAPRGGALSWGVCSSGGLFCGVPGGDPPGRLLLPAICILLECILVTVLLFYFLNSHKLNRHQKDVYL